MFRHPTAQIFVREFQDVQQIVHTGIVHPTVPRYEAYFRVRIAILLNFKTFVKAVRLTKSQFAPVPFYNDGSRLLVNSNKATRQHYGLSQKRRFIERNVPKQLAPASSAIYWNTTLMNPTSSSPEVLTTQCIT